MPQVFGTAQATSSGSERKLIFVGTNASPFIRWGEIDDNGEITYLPGPNVVPAGTVRGVSVFPDGSKVVLAHDGGSSFSVYNIGKTALTKDTSVPTLVSGGGATSVHISKDGQQVAIGTNSGQYLYVYSYGVSNPNEWTLLSAFSTMPTAVVRSVKYNNAGTALAICQSLESPSALAYTRAGSVYTNRSLTDLSFQSDARCIVWSYDNKVSSIAVNNNPDNYVQSYSLSGTTFTKLSASTNNLADNARQGVYSVGGSNIYVGLSGAPYVQSMDNIGTKLELANVGATNPLAASTNIAPTNTVLGMAMSHDNKFLAVASVDTSRRLWLYRPYGSRLDFVPCTDVAGLATAVAFYPRAEDV